MNASEPPSPVPPPLPPDAPAAPKPVARWRWIVHLIVIGSYPLVLGLMGAEMAGEGEQAEAALSPNPGALLEFSFLNLLSFAVLFAIGIAFSRPTRDALLLRWRKGVLPVLYGAGYSVGLRIAIGIIAAAIIGIYVGVSGVEAEQAKEIVTPKVEVLVDYDAIRDDYVYLILNMTIVSFLVAGLREELWRSACLAGLSAVFPKVFDQSTRGRVLGVLVAAVIFGLGHLTMGPGSVVLTGFLGVGLGLIMVFHRSIWEAVLAHGFFNATTFLLLHLVMRYRPELLEAL